MKQNKIKLNGYSTIETLIIIPIFSLFIAIILYLYNINVHYLVFSQAVKESNDLITMADTIDFNDLKGFCEERLNNYFNNLIINSNNISFSCIENNNTLLVEAKYTMYPISNLLGSGSVSFKEHNYITGLEILKE